MQQQIFVNGRFTSQRVTGVQRYAGEVTRRLGEKVHVLRPSGNTVLGRGHVWEQITLPGLVGKGGLLWSPANSGPLRVARQVVTIHDLSTIDHPEWFDPRYAAWYGFLLPRLARRAVAVLTVSEFSKQRIIEMLDIAEQKVHVIPNGVDERFAPQPETEITRVRRKYGLPKPYLLAVGSLEPRKNLAELLRVWGLAGSRLSGSELVVAGERGRVFREAAAERIPPGVHLLGYVEDADLPSLYSGAMASVYLSLYEGFGLPILESMACGTPVLASKRGSLPEVTGKAGLLIDPTDSEEVLAAIMRLTQDNRLRDDLSAAGLERVRRYSWDTTSQQIWKVLSEINALD
jgi:glycosyltransferase involved in cell wall biosynthesis